MRNLRYICVQPAIPYYLWQVETVIHNFAKHNINPNNLDIVCALPPGHVAPPEWRKLADTYNYVRFFFYEDNRGPTPYLSSVRPHVLKQHFTRFPEMHEEAIFYFDCDMIFTRRPDWSKFVDDDVWYCSDTRFYIGAEYIKGKEFGVYEEMCKIVGIDPAIPVREELNSGGAQYLMKNVNAEYWAKVEKDCDDLYRFFNKHLEDHPEVKPEDATPERPAYHPIQRWTADMWAVLWNGWYFGHTVKVVPEMEFCWGTQEKVLWNERAIFHNAGVLDTNRNLWFYKSDYQSSLPYDIPNHCDPKTASHWYLEEVLETGKKSCLRDCGIPMAPATTTTTTTTIVPTTLAPTTQCPT